MKRITTHLATPLAVALALGTLAAQGGCATTASNDTDTTKASTTEPADLKPGWAEGRVFYLVFVRSFADSTAGPLAADGKGDLRGLIERLDYLNDGDPATTTDLGITGLWLMPIAQSPSYHGYDTTDYFRVDDEYGTNDDFRELVEEAHKRGIGVVVDLVLNHTSWQHPWFTESTTPGSARRDWYRWERTKPDQLGPWGQPVWHDHKAAESGAFYYGLFWHGMPDLNFHNPDVSKAMGEVATFWLNDMHADGFRLDAVKYLIESGTNQESTPETLRWLRDFNRHVKRTQPHAWTVGEIWSSRESIAAYIAPDGPGANTPLATDSAFDFPMAYAIMEGLRDDDPARIRRELVESWDAFGNRASTFLSNHDMDRAFSQWKGNAGMAKAAATLLMTAPGTPFLYYGEEIGLAGAGPHEDVRRPMRWTDDPDNAGFTTASPWEPLGSEPAANNVRTLSDDPDSLLRHYRRLIRVRQASGALARGSFTPVDASDKRVVAFLRTHRGERVLTIVNASGDTVEGCTITTRGLHIGSRTELTDLLADTPIESPRRGEGWTPIPSMPPYASSIIRLEN